MRSGPRLRICSCTAWLAPSPTARIETTDATPKTIPSTVSAERSLCTRRLRVPMRTSWNQSCRTIAPASVPLERALELADGYARVDPGAERESLGHGSLLGGPLDHACSGDVERHTADDEAVERDLQDGVGLAALDVDVERALELGPALGLDLVLGFGHRASRTEQHGFVLDLLDGRLARGRRRARHGRRARGFRRAARGRGLELDRRTLHVREGLGRDADLVRGENNELSGAKSLAHLDVLDAGLAEAQPAQHGQSALEDVAHADLPALDDGLHGHGEHVLLAVDEHLDRGAHARPQALGLLEQGDLGLVVLHGRATPVLRVGQGGDLLHLAT